MEKKERYIADKKQGKVYISETALASMNEKAYKAFERYVKINNFELVPLESEKDFYIKVFEVKDKKAELKEFLKIIEEGRGARGKALTAYRKAKVYADRVLWGIEPKAKESIKK